MRVHAIQVAYDDDESMSDRITRVADLVAAQADADLVVLPELWSAGGFAYRSWPERAEPLTGPTVTAIAEAARSIGAYVHAGSIIERAVPDAEGQVDLGESGRGLWNTSVLLDPQGEIIASYRKIHRFGFGQGEPSLIEAGRDVVAPEIVPRSRADASAITVGLSTCYDLRFPELYRALLDAGALIALVPAAWPAARVEAWQLLGRARAMENQIAVVQCNTAGTHSRTPMGGRSQIVDAHGGILALASGDEEQVLIAEIDTDAVLSWRKDFPVLGDRRL